MSTDHLNALELGLSNERVRLSESRTDRELAMRLVWIAQREKEIACEKAFLGLPAETEESISDDDLLAQLLA